MTINEMAKGFKDFNYEEITIEVLTNCSPIQLSKLMHLLEEEQTMRMNTKLSIEKILNQRKKIGG